MDVAYVVMGFRFDPHKPGRLLGMSGVGLKEEREARDLYDDMRLACKGYWRVNLYRVTRTACEEIDHACSHAVVHEEYYPLLDVDVLIRPWVLRTQEVIGEACPDVIPPQPEVDESFAFAHVFAKVKEETEREAVAAAVAVGAASRLPGAPDGEAVMRVALHERLPGTFLVPPAPTVTDAKRAMDFPDAEKVTLGEGITVAVLDTGYQPHVALQGATVSGVIDCTGIDSPVGDANGHGTFCVSQIASHLPQGDPFGTARKVRIVPIRVLHFKDGYGADSWIARGIRAAVKVGARVISMSLGGDDPTPLTHVAIQEAKAAGVIVVVAAGNGGPVKGDVSYPARYQEVIGVGATDDDAVPAPYSQRGPNLNVWACGTAQVGATHNDTYGRWSGTSMAAPHVAAAVAMFSSRFKSVFDSYPDLGDVRGILWATDAPVNAERDRYGLNRGIVQAGKMVSSVKAPPPDPVPVDPPDSLLVEVDGSIGSESAALYTLAHWLLTDSKRRPITFVTKPGPAGSGITSVFDVITKLTIPE